MVARSFAGDNLLRPVCTVTTASYFVFPRLSVLPMSISSIVYSYGITGWHYGSRYIPVSLDYQLTRLVHADRHSV